LFPLSSISQWETDVSSLRTIGGDVGLLVGVTVAVGLGIKLAAPVGGYVFLIVVLGSLGYRLGSLTPPSVGEHQLLLRYGPVIGAFAGFFLGLYLVDGFPAKGAFGWQVVACCAACILPGLVLPWIVITKLMYVRCPQCHGHAYFGTDSTFFRKMLAQYHYRCRSCGHTQSRG
jgi:hypothetical protein